MENLPVVIVKIICLYTVRKELDIDVMCDAIVTNDLRSFMCSCKKFASICDFFYVWVKGRCHIESIYVSTSIQKARSYILSQLTSPRHGYGNFYRAINNFIGYENLNIPIPKPTRKLIRESTSDQIENKDESKKRVYINPFFVCSFSSIQGSQILELDVPFYNFQ